MFWNIVWLARLVLESSESLTETLHDIFRKDLSYFLSLCRSLPKGKFSAQKGTYTHEGQFLGKNIIAEYQSGTSEPPRRELHIRIPVIQKFWLRLLSQSFETDLHDELKINDEAMDSTFIIHSDHPQIATEFLKRPFILNELPHFREIKRLEFHRGKLNTILFGGKFDELKVPEFLRIMNFLARLADDYELQSSLFKLIPARIANSNCRIAGKDS